MQLNKGTLYKRRLLRLARHLLHGTLAHSVFDFSTWNAGFSSEQGNNKKGNICGTYGCAIGECPRVFPTFFKWDYEFIVTKQYKGLFPREEEAKFAFFGVDHTEVACLFLPFPNTVGRLPETANRYDVAKNIISFVQKKHGKVRLTKEDVAQLALATLC